jgi:sporulation protein YlmC with PRC-barrel domain
VNGEHSDQAISYKALERGVEVVTADGAPIGTVDEVLDNVRENIFDGIVVATPEGKRFVDAPEVARITVGAVTLSIGAERARELPVYRRGAPEFQANPRVGRLGRIFGGGWRRR